MCLIDFHKWTRHIWLISSCSWFNYPHLAGIELGTINRKYHRKSVAFDIQCDKIRARPGTVKHVYCRFNKRVFLVYILATAVARS